VEHQVNGSRTGKRLDTSDYSASPKVPIVLTSARRTGAGGSGQGNGGARNLGAGSQAPSA
jgi:hypothetical protein